jgi:transcriptional regulator with XRE-family HTH domain
MTQGTTNKTWGSRVRAERQRQGLTVLELSRLAGTDPGNLSRLERGLQGTRDALRVRLAAALGVEVTDLFPYPSTTEVECPSATCATGAAGFGERTDSPSPARDATAPAIETAARR